MKICVARQPIYNADTSIFAYELLYRSGKINAFPVGTDSKTATLSVVSDALVSFGLGELTNNKIAFVNFDKALIMSEIPDLLTNGRFVIEILETTDVDDFFLAHVKMWKQKGYIFALDDYVGEDGFSKLLPYVDIVKVDFKLTTSEQRLEIAQKLLPLGKQLLAEKVETEEEYKTAKSAGYTLFQGYFFGHPMMLSRELPNAQKITYSRIFRELSGKSFEFRKLSRIVRNDVNLSYKLLNNVNTYRYYRGHRISSVHSALVHMGAEEIRKWISLVFIRDSVVEHNDENVKTALARGVFAELVAVMLNKPALRDDAFMAGMFSMIDIIMQDNMINVLDTICVSDEVREALLQKDGDLSGIIKFVLNYEQGNWKEALTYAKSKKLNIDKLSRGYILTLRYADGVFS